MKHFFRVGDKVRLYRNSPISNVGAGEEGEVTKVYEDDGKVKYIVFFHMWNMDQIIHQPHLSRVKE